MPATPQSCFILIDAWQARDSRNIFCTPATPDSFSCAFTPPGALNLTGPSEFPYGAIIRAGGKARGRPGSCSAPAPLFLGAPRTMLNSYPLSS